MELLELVLELITGSGKWFRGPKTEHRYWYSALLALVCWTVLAVLISVVIMFIPSGDTGGDASWFFFMAALMTLPAWVAFVIGWRSELAGAILGVAAGLLLFCWLGCGMLYVTGSMAYTLFFSVVVPLPPLAVGVVCLVGYRRSTAADKEKRERLRGEYYDATLEYRQTGASLRGADLSRRDLTGIDLSSADLRGANLKSADLSGANLEGGDLSNANLYFANLQGATLREATLDQSDIRYANLRDSQLQGAVLWKANLQEADLRGADLQRADLLEANLAGARLDDSTVMPEGWEEIVATKAAKYADFSPMPEEFADFERMLEEFKAKSGTLLCLECGHHNPVGQSQCEECHGWVPQTAKARWAHARGK